MRKVGNVSQLIGFQFSDSKKKRKKAWKRDYMPKHFEHGWTVWKTEKDK